MCAMRIAALSAISLMLSALGCASDREAVEKRLAGLRDDITRVQTENDRLAERVDALENKAVPASVAPVASENKLNRPPLKVVKLMPGEAMTASNDPDAPDIAPEERPDAPGTRPVIRLRGKPEGRDEGRASVRSSRQTAEDSQ
jgi:hypothetical protein